MTCNLHHDRALPLSIPVWGSDLLTACVRSLVRYRLTNTFYALKVISKRVVLQKKQVSKVVRERENLAICNAAIAASGSMLKVHAVFQDERNLYLLTE